MEIPVTVTFDLNVLVDVYQEREPHFQDSREALNWATSGLVRGIFPSHALTTLYYLLRKEPGRFIAKGAIEFVLSHLKIVSLDNDGFRAALNSQFADFEDAVVSATAVHSGSQLIITRDLDDFEHSTVEAISPIRFLERMAESMK